MILSRARRYTGPIDPATVTAVLFFALGASALGFFAWRESKKRDRTWEMAVQILSGGRSRRQPGDPPGFDLLTPDGVHLVARFKRSGEDEILEYVAHDDLPPEIQLGAESITTRLGKLLLGPDVETGDDAFDRAVFMRGSEVRLLAMLDQRLRSDLRQAVEAGTTLTGGELRRLSGRGPSTLEEVLAPARELARLAKRIAERATQPVPVLLRENALGDPSPKVRLRCLQALVADFRGHAETQAALDGASVDPDPDVRFLALGNAATGGFDALSSMVSDTNLRPDARAEALSRLLAAHPGSRSIEIAERALSDHSSVVRIPAIRAVGSARRASALPALLRLAGAMQSTDERVALADAFWRLRDPLAETPLLRFLGDGEESVRVAAARALGRCGGIDAVVPLRALTGGLFAGDAGRVAREAIETIQGRLRHAGEGQVSVVGPAPTEGGVSLAAEAGAVSVAPRPKGEKTGA